MTTRLDVIKRQSRDVITEHLSETWEYRRLTSVMGREPRTYETWTEFPALATAGSNFENYDPNRDVFKQSTVQRIRTTDEATDPPLGQGDQVRGPNGSVWAVSGVATSGPGTVAYSLSRETGLTGDADRKGGV
jgi:hypothetical protein